MLCNRSTPLCRAALAAGTVLVVALAVSSCGGDKPKTQASPPEPTSQNTFAEASQSPAPAPGDLKTTTTTTSIPVPTDGPREVAHFPVPKGVKVNAPAPGDRAWQFDILTKDTDGVLAFYRKALPAAGYTVKNDVTLTIGEEKVHYDIQFGGRAEGYIVADKSENDVFVLVQSLPKS